MSDQPKTITREALYTLVWRKPMREIAPSLNISDTGLAKLCRRHNIPRPPQGYWLKIQHGRQVEQTPLPAAVDGRTTTIQLPRLHTSPLPTQPALPLPPISHKKARHALIKQCRNDYKGASVNDYGRLVSHHRADVDVSRKSLQRALSLLNTLIHSVEASGHQVRYAHHQKAIELNIDGECLCLAIKETATRSDRVLTKEQQNSLDQHGYCFGKRWDYTPSGKLTLLVNGHRLYGTRSSWSDKKRTPLEAELPNILAGILACAQRLKDLRVEDQIREYRFAVNQRRAQRIDKAIALRQQRIQAVEHMVVGLERANAIRACLKEVADSSNTLPTTTKRLHRWAEQLARHYDPCDPFTVITRTSADSHILSRS